MTLLQTLAGKFAKLAALNILALIAWSLLHSSPLPGAVLAWTLVGLAGLLDVGWIAIGLYAFARTRRAA